MPSVAPELYVYYRVPAEHAPTARAQVRHAQAALAGLWPTLTCRLLERFDEGDATAVTWMETYAAEGGLGEPARQRVLDTMKDLPSGRIGERHVEWFAPLAD